MATYRLADGRTVSDEDLVRDAREWESGAWRGTLKGIHVGPAPISNEALVTVTVKFPRSMVAAIDAQSSNRSDYIRRAVADRLSKAS